MTLHRFLILLIATVVGVVAATAAVMTRPGDDAYANLGDPVVPGLIDRVNEVAKIRIESQEGGVLTFQRQVSEQGLGKDWSVIERDMYPAKEELAKSLALKVAQLTYLAPKTRNPDLYPRLELGDPAKPGTQSTAVKLMDKSGNLMADLIIGRARGAMEGSTHGGAYFRLPGQDQAWVGRGGMEVDRLIFDWIERDLFDIKTKRIESVEILHPDGEKIRIFKDHPDDLNFILADLPEDRKVKDTFAVNGIASTIGDFQILDVIKRGKHKIDPAKSVRLVYKTFDGLTITALLEEQITVEGGEEVESHWVDINVVRAPVDDATDAAAKKKAEEEIALFKARTDDWVYKISDFRFDSLAKRLKDILEPAGNS